MQNGADKFTHVVGARPEKIAIVALGPSSYDYIRHCDRDGNRRNLFDETWTVNSFCNLIESDRLFHMDDIRVQELRAIQNTRVRHMLQAMKEYKGPIITSVPHPDYPNSVKFPLAEAVSAFSSLYFNNTMPYSIAYAMLLGVKHITFFGLDYVWPNMAEAESGRSCTEYWIAKAQDRGIVTRVAKSSTLLDARHAGEGVKLYGYDAFDVTLEEPTPGKQILKMKEKELPTAEQIEARYYKLAPKTLEAIIGPEQAKIALENMELEQKRLT